MYKNRPYFGNNGPNWSKRSSFVDKHHILTGNMKNNGSKNCGYLSRAGKSNDYDIFKNESMVFSVKPHNVELNLKMSHRTLK